MSGSVYGHSEMPEPAFRRFVADALEALFEQVDALEPLGVDAESSAGVVKVGFPDGGVFVLSQQVPARELWLSANLRAWHFLWDGAAWVERDSGESMLEVLGQLFSGKLGRHVAFAANVA